MSVVIGCLLNEDVPGLAVEVVTKILPFWEHALMLVDYFELEAAAELALKELLVVAAVAVVVMGTEGEELEAA